MPWSNQGGGPWGSGPKGPWGSGSPPPGSSPPDLEDLLRRGQDKLRNVLPGGGLGGTGILIIALVAVILWLSSGFFQVAPDELGLVMRFGKFDRKADPGLSYHLPYPIESVEIPKVTRVTPIQIGFRNVEDRRGTQTRDVPEESLMLTGDENIVDVDFTVFWVVAAGTTGASDFRFNLESPDGTVKAVAESAMREVIGRSELEPVLTGGRQRIETEVHDLVQKTLDQYKAGITVAQVQMLKVEAPAQVIDAFRDVQAAQADQERVQNEARAYAGRVVPEAKGRAAQLIQSAEAYRLQTVAEATGQTARFNKIYEEYKKAPDVTRQRLYLETMERLFGGTDKIILDSSGQGGSGVVPYLPLPELRNRQPAQPPQSSQSTTGGNR
jgi:modulator of FtsH protease HflK